MKYLTLIITLLVICNSTFAQQCDDGLIEDCNGYCVPMAWLQDDICDDGTVQEYPPGSGYYADFSCEDYMCDIFNCPGCEGGCPAGFVPDCNGNCAPVGWVADGICDYGQREYNDVAIVFACQQFACDLGDCAGPCWDDSGYGGLDDVGACCIDGVCSEITRGNCYAAIGEFKGANTLCQSATCGCGSGWTADCNGNCVQFEHAGGSWCPHGEWVDYGDGPFQVNLDCLELACGFSGCLGSCPGACCVAGGCETTPTYQTCLDMGGLFLGSYVSCDEGAAGCVEQQKPIQLPDTELEWSGDLGTVIWGPQWIVSEEDILVFGAVVVDEKYEWKTAICVYRYDVDQWVEEALLTAPSGRTIFQHAAYTTDGTRIAVGSQVDWGEPTQRYIIDIFAYDSKTETWSFEQTIDDGYYAEDNLGFQWGNAIDIDGDTLVISDPELNGNFENNGGGGQVYRFDGSSWNFEQTLLPFGTPPYPDGFDLYLGSSVAVEDDIVVLASTSSLLIYDVGTNPATEVQHLREMIGNSWPRHRSIDLDNNRLMTQIVVSSLMEEYLVSKIFEPIAGVWTETAALHPFDIAGTDWAGYIVDLEGSHALVTSPRDNDLGLQTGSAYVWEHDGENWHFIAKLWSDRAVGGDQFGISAALHGSNAYLSGYIEEDEGDNIKVFWPRGISWINPLGGNISDATNWDPAVPTTSDSVSFSLRSQTRIKVDQDFPYQHMFIGPGGYEFDLQGVDRILGDGGETINLQGVPGLPAEFKLKGGILTIDGEIHIGEGDLPGKIAIGSNSEGQLGKLIVNGLYLQHDAGELIVELKTERPPLIQLKNVSPQLDGILALHFANGYVPQDGDIIQILTAEVVDDNAGQFSMVVIRDPLPDGLYIKLNYEGGDGGKSGSISAEVDQLSNLFGYGDPNSETVTGTATDIVLADLGSSSRVADGYDDIAVTTVDAIHVFLSDGNGGISSQVTYMDSAFTSLAAIDAGDLDGDGTLDLVVVNSNSNEFIPIYNEFQDIASLSIGDPVSTGPYPTDVLAINTDTDADADVIVACYGYSFTDGQIDFFESISSFRGITFVSSGSLPSPGNPGKINPGDVNNDKDFKVYVSFGSSNSAGAASDNPSVRGFGWEYVTMASVATGPSNIVIGDLNGDSIEDVVVACPESDVLTVLTGISDGSLSSPLYLFVGQEPTSIELLDFDNDGDKDIAVVATNPETGQRAVMMYRNDTSNNGGNLMFANDSTYDDGSNPILVAKGDIDGDGHDDLVSITQTESFRGVSNNVLLRQSDTATVCPADFDGNNIVNVLDLLTIIAAWDATGNIHEDLDGNGVVNVLDLLILIAAWGPCA
jgi:hypothetical protein